MEEPRCELCHEEIKYCECVRCLCCGTLYSVDEADYLRGDRDNPSCVKCGGTCELCHEEVRYCECRRCTECEELQLITLPMREDGSCSGCDEPARDCLCDDEYCRKCGGELY